MIDELPVFFDMVYTKEDGRLAPDGYLYNDQTFQTLNQMLFLINSIVLSTSSTTNEITMINNGLIAPSKTTAEITAIEPDAPDGTIWFNTNLTKLQVKTASGVVETITSV